MDDPRPGPRFWALSIFISAVIVLILVDRLESAVQWAVVAPAAFAGAMLVASQRQRWFGSRRPDKGPNAVAILAIAAGFAVARLLMGATSEGLGAALMGGVSWGAIIALFWWGPVGRRLH